MPFPLVSLTELHTVLEEVRANPFTMEAWFKWGGRKRILQAELGDAGMTELRELFDINLYSTDGEAYERTLLGDALWQYTNF